MNIWTVLLVAAIAACLIHIRKQHRETAECRLKLQQLQQQHGNLENILERRGRRLDVLFSAVNEVVMRVDRLGRVLAMNAQANEIFQPDRLLELPQSMLVLFREPEWHRAFSDALRRLPEASSLPDIHIGERVLAVRLAPLGKEQALLLCVDMTRQAKLEKQRKTFLANLMHDLKTPLTSLLGYARSIESFGEDSELRREATRVIADEAKYLDRLLDSLLTLDQIQYTRDNEEQTCNATDVIRQVHDSLKPQLDARSMQIGLTLPAEGMQVAINSDSLTRALTNVLDNAICYAPDQSRIMLDMSVEGDRCLIRVCDEGPGIPERHLPQVTERFYRVDKSRERQAGGHGLGLAIVKELVEKNDGVLNLSNLESHGLQAEIILPLALENAA
ncbi:MAG: sensor histidine kinase [Mariprofundaceae bacterium]